MICYICKEEFKDTNINFICNNCDEAAYLCHAMSASYNEWNETLVCEDRFWIRSKLFIKKLINKVNKDITMVEQAKEILRGIIDQIKLHLKYYDKDEVIVALLVVKESVRRLELKEKKDSVTWKMINDYQLSVRLISLVGNIPTSDFLGESIGNLEHGYSNFISAICLGRIVEILDENIKNLKFLDIDIKSIDEVIFSFIETEEMKKYYEKYWEMALEEKPEDYKIKNELLNAKVEKEGKTPNSRRNDINPFIKKQFGFKLDDLNLFSKIIVREEFETNNDLLEYCRHSEIYNEYVPQLAIFNREVLKKNIIEYYSDFPLDNIINTFSINQHFTNTDKKYEKAMELMSVYETGELIVLGRVDFSQNVSAFDKFSNSGHYLEMFKPSIKSHKSIIECQNKLSTYLAYVLVDKLYENGYKLPMEKQSSKMGGENVPRAEIDKIDVDGINILSKVGDLDVLAIDSESKCIFIIEIKNYKPAITSKDLFYKDKSKIKDKEVIKKMKSRECVVKNNIQSVVEYIIEKKESDYSDYQVKTLFVTSRPNYYACNIKEGINYITWSEIIKKIETKQL